MRRASAIYFENCGYLNKENGNWFLSQMSSLIIIWKLPFLSHLFFSTPGNIRTLVTWLVRPLFWTEWPLIKTLPLNGTPLCVIFQEYRLVSWKEDKFSLKMVVEKSLRIVLLYLAKMQLDMIILNYIEILVIFNLKIVYCY